MQPAMQNPTNARQGIDATNRRFMDAFNAGDIAGAAQGVYTKDARVLPPGGDTVQGRENIVQFWQGAAQALGITRVQLTTVELEIQGDSAYEIGRADLTVAGGKQSAVAKYVVVWKQESGEWRWHIDIWIMNS